MKEVKLKQLEEKFLQAEKLLEQNKITEAKELIEISLPSDMYDMAVDLIEGQSKDKYLINLGKLCKKVFVRLERDLLPNNIDESDEEYDIIVDNKRNLAIEDGSGLTDQELLEEFNKYLLNKDKTIED